MFKNYLMKHFHGSVTMDSNRKNFIGQNTFLIIETIRIVNFNY